MRWAVVAVALLVLAGCSNTPPVSSPSGGAAPPSAAVSAPAEAVSAGPVGFLSGEGQSLVPEQLAPGTYQSAGPSGTQACSAFVTDRDGQPSGFEVSRGRTTIVVPAGAGGVKAYNCLPFTKVR